MSGTIKSRDLHIAHMQQKSGEQDTEFLQAILLGEKQADVGKVISLEQLESNMKNWISEVVREIKSSKRNQ
jgi:hypothetical protein